LFHNKPYSTAKRKNSGTGWTRLTALTAALRNGKMKTKEKEKEVPIKFWK